MIQARWRNWLNSCLTCLCHGIIKSTPWTMLYLLSTSRDTVAMSKTSWNTSRRVINSCWTTWTSSWIKSNRTHSSAKTDWSGRITKTHPRSRVVRLTPSSKTWCHSWRRTSSGSSSHQNSCATFVTSWTTRPWTSATRKHSSSSFSPLLPNTTIKCRSGNWRVASNSCAWWSSVWTPKTSHLRCSGRQRIKRT